MEYLGNLEPLQWVLWFGMVLELFGIVLIGRGAWDASQVWAKSREDARNAAVELTAVGITSAVGVADTLVTAHDPTVAIETRTLEEAVTRLEERLDSLEISLRRVVDEDLREIRNSFAELGRQAKTTAAEAEQERATMKREIVEEIRGAVDRIEASLNTSFSWKKPVVGAVLLAAGLALSTIASGIAMNPS